ncbi:hypothetical protein FM109_14280 [Vibrio casei]|nr:hypothetical protein FM109_14280 [Vibrio casei]
MACDAWWVDFSHCFSPILRGNASFFLSNILAVVQEFEWATDKQYKWKH